MSEFKQYRRSQIAELRPYVQGEDLNAVSISAPDRAAGSPKPGDMIARNPANHADQWLVAAKYFADNFESARDPVDEPFTGKPVGVAQPVPVGVESQEARDFTFRQSLESTINAHSRENGSDTPDFILAQYLLASLAAFDAAVSRRSQWYGGKDRVGS